MNSLGDLELTTLVVAIALGKLCCCCMMLSYLFNVSSFLALQYASSYSFCCSLVFLDKKGCQVQGCCVKITFEVKVVAFDTVSGQTLLLVWEHGSLS